MDLPVNQIICGDCLEVMPLLPERHYCLQVGYCYSL
jgi:DNA modification methylase